MADWRVTLTRNVIVNGAFKALQTDHVVEGTTRELAIALGIDELFTREAAGGFKLVPQEAVNFWRVKRQSGGLLYEIQSELENQWGLTFGIADAAGAASEHPPPGQAHAPRSRNGTSHSDELPDLTTMLENHLKQLTARQMTLGEELCRKQAEYDRNNSDIMRITQVLTTLTPPPPTPAIPMAIVKPKKKPPKVSHAE